MIPRYSLLIDSVTWIAAEIAFIICFSGKLSQKVKIFI